VRIKRSTKVLGFADGRTAPRRHRLRPREVPVTNLIGEPGAGFAMDRPARSGRIHHCMRLLGMAERSFDLMCERAHARSAFARRCRASVVRDVVARLDPHRGGAAAGAQDAWLIDTSAPECRGGDLAIKVSVPRSAA